MRNRTTKFTTDLDSTRVSILIGAYFDNSSVPTDAEHSFFYKQISTVERQMYHMYWFYGNFLFHRNTKSPKYLYSRINGWAPECQAAWLHFHCWEMQKSCLWPKSFSRHSSRRQTTHNATVHEDCMEVSKEKMQCLLSWWSISRNLM